MNLRFKWVASVAFLILIAPLARRACAEEMVGRLTAANKAQYAGMPRLVIEVSSLVNRRTLKLAVPNQDEKKPQFDPLPDVLATVKSLKQGDVVKVDYEMKYNFAMVKTIALYPVKPGEELPNGFVFNETYQKKVGNLDFQMVDATKFEQVITFVIPNKKDAATGDLAPDAELLAAATQLKPGDVALIDTTNTRPNPTVRSIEAYTPPQPGHFLKSKEENDEGGRKNMIAEIEVDGKTIDAIVPGHLDGKKWVPDAKVLREVRRLLPNVDVMFRVTNDNGKTWLRDIEKAAQQSHATLGPKPAGDTTGAKPADGAKPDAKAADGAAK